MEKFDSQKMIPYDDTKDPDEEESLRRTLSIRDNSTISPVIWVPLSLFIAVIYAIANNLASYLSHYGFKLRYIMAPGSLFANVLALMAISHSNFIQHEQVANSDDYSLTNIRRGKSGFDLEILFDWFYDIYFHVEVELHQKASDEGPEIKHKYYVKWKRVYATIILCILNVLQYWAFTEGYYYATLADVNSGVIMSMYSIKPVLSGLCFYFFFNQTLSIYEIIGIILSIVCIALVTFSTESLIVVDAFDWNLLISTILIIISVLFLCVTAVIMKQHFAYKSNDINLPAFVNFFNFIVDFVFLLLFFFEHILGEVFDWHDIFLAQIAGFLWSFATFLIVYVNLRGKAGTSDALIQT